MQYSHIYRLNKNGEMLSRKDMIIYWNYYQVVHLAEQLVKTREVDQVILLPPMMRLEEQMAR